MGERSETTDASAYGVWIAIGLVILYIALAVVQSPDPLNLDNMDFPAVAKATSESGIPIYYRGELEQLKSGLYHPPLYIYMLAGWFKVFGFSEAAARLFGSTNAVVAAIITWLTASNLLGRKAALTIAPMFVAFYLVNPFSIQVFGIADIDSSIFVVLLSLAVLIAVRLNYSSGETRSTPIGAADYGAIIAVIFFCCWAKLTTTLLLPAIFVYFHAARTGWWSAVLAIGIASGIAFILFVASFSVYGTLSGLDTGYTWRFLIESFTSKTGGTSTPASVLTRLWVNFRAFGNWGLWVPMVAAGVTGGLALKDVVIGRRRTRSVGLVGIFWPALAMCVGYSIITEPFGGAPFKYLAPAWPIFSLLAAVAIGDLVGGESKISSRTLFLLALFGGAGAGIGYYLIRDRSILDGSLPPWIWLVAPSIVGAAAGIVLVALRRARNRLVASRTTMYISVVFAAQSLGVAAFQVRADYSTQYDYGQTGMVAASQWLAENTGPDEVIMSMKDIGFRTNRRYLESYQFIYGGDKAVAELGDLVPSLGIKVFVFTERHGQDQLFINPALSAWIGNNTALAKKFGDYVIYTAN